MTPDARSTGPRTEAGKAISARNSTKHGLFTQRDFVLEGEDEEYAQTFTVLMDELSPEGIIEQTFATEIMGATWRLRRCRILEFDLARTADRAPEAQDALQKSIDRARAQSHNILRRSMAELRLLRTERQTRSLMIPGGVASSDLGLTDTRKAVKTAAQSLLAAENSSFCKPAPAASSFCKPPQTAEKSGNGSFCKPPAATPRNALCPCGSGTKYKRCCGRNAPPVLNKAA